MQNTSISGHASPLAEQLTLVVITHDRPESLLRALQYYNNYRCSLLILDSSQDAAEGVADLYPEVNYQHFPQFNATQKQDKLAFGLSLITTPYMLVAADDDFIIHDAMTESVEFLQDNPDYGLCLGYSLAYEAFDNRVEYSRRDKKVQEDYSSAEPHERVLEFFKQFIPLFYAVTRTQLMRNWLAALPNNTGDEWAEIGHAYFLLSAAKARILPIAYSVREVDSIASDRLDSVVKVLSANSAQGLNKREEYAAFLAGLFAVQEGLDISQLKQLTLAGFDALQQGLANATALTVEPIFWSSWTSPLAGPVRQFGPKQYVEMPFYNQAFFDQLTQIEFLVHLMPSGRQQLEQLEGVWVHQQETLHIHETDSPETITERLWPALDRSPFNSKIVKSLAEKLKYLGEKEESAAMFDWLQRLEAISVPDRSAQLAKMPSGRLLDWEKQRSPSIIEGNSIAAHLDANQGGPQFCLLLLNLGDNNNTLQKSLDSLMGSQFRAFKIVVFTTGTPPTTTSARDMLHFVRVTSSNYIEKVNQAALQTSCNWLLLAQSGDQFTSSGLLRASLELLAAPDCRAVFADEIQRTPSGALVDVFRPGFNLDLLQSLPALMARHWLIRKDVFADAGGYSADFRDALEFDLLLRIIERGGMAWLAHLDEPLLVCEQSRLVENAHERLALTRHLTNRGYKAHVNSLFPGTYQVDYRHTLRPLVSIIVRSRNNIESLKRCLTSVMLKTRYRHYDFLIVDDQSTDTETVAWLALQEYKGSRTRVMRNEQGLNASALLNQACTQAKGEYLLLLADDSQVVSPNWVELLLNQAQRPEVGAVGAKLMERDGTITQAGLILGLNGGVSSPFKGDKKQAKGYMHRLVLEQSYSAVSAACLMVRKELFDAVGGLDETDFIDAYSDVDLCLKIGQAGYMTVWTPQVEIIHPGTMPESATALVKLRSKWNAQFAHDQAYNSNLALTGKGFTLGDVSSVNWTALLG